jgi:putative sigma-54 modulation protein
MKLQVHSIHFDDKLETFYDRIVNGEVYLRLDKGEHSRENKVVEIKVNIPGGILFAKELSTTFESATDMAVESLKAQIKKHKEKLFVH